MSITRDGWFDFAERLHGWPSKVNGGRNGLLGLAAHSAEGWETYLRQYQIDRERRASWHLSNLRNGVLLQHYPVFAQTWTSGAGWPNSNLIGMESEGVAGQPLNDAQLNNVVRVLRDLSAFTGRNEIQRIGGRAGAPPDVLVIVEHREATRWGAEPTSCPSGRYDWDEVFRRLAPEPEPEPVEEEEMFHRWGGLANDGTFRGLGISNRDQEVWGRHDWHLPHEAKSVELALYLRAGQVEVLDGDKAKAGFATEGVSTHRVFMDAGGEGKFYLRSFPFNAEAVVEQIECLGWYS